MVAASKTLGVPLKTRAITFFSLWLGAGVLWAVLSPYFGLAPEAGEDFLVIQLRIVVFAPLLAAEALAFCVVPGGYNAWPGRQEWQVFAMYAFLAVFLFHAVMTLSRSRRKGFVCWTGVQLAYLTAATAAVFYFIHWDSLHMHG